MERYVIYVLLFWPEIFQNAVGLLCFGPGAGRCSKIRKRFGRAMNCHEILGFRA